MKFITRRTRLPHLGGYIDVQVPLRWNKRSFRQNTKCDRSTGCWLWTGPVDRRGYGRTLQTQAHRLAYELFIGPLSADLEVDHLCRNKLCVNPDHLEAVTHRENVLRGNAPSAIYARQTHCRRGHPFDGDNLGFTKSGHRVCLACRRARKRESTRRWRARQKNG
jgi:hypothetical protein